MNYVSRQDILKINSIYCWALLVTLAAAFIALFLSFQAGVFALLFAILAWWCWQHPHDAVLLLLLIAPALPMLKITQTLSTATLAKDVIIIALFLKLFFIPLLTKKLPYRYNPLLIPLAVLILWTLVNTFRSDTIILGILRARDIGLYTLFFLAFLYLPPKNGFYRQLYLWFIASFSIIAALATFQWFIAPDSTVLRFDPARAIWIPRISSILAHPSIFGQYLIIFITLVTSSLLIIKNRLGQYINGLVLLLTSILIYLTYSRAVWIGTIAAIAIILLTYFIGRLRKNYSFSIRSPKAVIGLILVLILIIIITLFTPAGTFLRTTVDPTYGSNVERLTFLSRLIAPMTDLEAIVGRGLGDVVEQNLRNVNLTTYDIATATTRNVQLAKNRTLVDNQHLKTFVEMGLLGLLIYGWLYWSILKLSWRASLSSSRKTAVIGLTALGFFTAFIIQGFFIDIWDIFPTNAVFWLIAALVVQNISPNTEAGK